MRRALLALAALALCACGRSAPARCDMEVAREIAFTGAEAPESLVVQAIGPSCDKSVGLFVVRTADGYPVWSWSAPLSHRFGDVFAEGDAEHMQSFLDTWAQPDLSTTQSAPAWGALTQGQTSLDRLTYEDVRARSLPMLCHFSGTGRQTCVFWEPAAGGAGHLLDRDIEENRE